jgi:CheY-like chemotaxis protein
MKILVVEDNVFNRDLIRRFLEPEGFEVVVAHDGVEGLARAVSDRPDLVLMDMSLPVVDGWEATRRMKADPATASIPVIALTAHAMLGDRERALEAGCDDYDTKPIDIERLLAKIRALLSARQGA